MPFWFGARAYPAGWLPCCLRCEPAGQLRSEGDTYLLIDLEEQEQGSELSGGASVWSWSISWPDDSSGLAPGVLQLMILWPMTTWVSPAH